MSSRPLLTALVLLVALVPLAAAAPPNVVLLISDDQAWTDYSFMGHATIRTPHLERLASQSRTFRRGYVPSSLCCPSLASIVTGLYPHQHKVTSNDPPRPAGMKPAAFYQSEAFAAGRETMSRHLEAVPTLPRLLAQHGYLCLQTGKWWQGHYQRGGFTHGMTRGQRHGDEGLSIGRKTMQPIYDFIETATREKKPFFVWYAPMMPHDPHTPPQRLLDHYRDKTKSIHVARYWAMVEWFDETCGALLAHLDARKLADDTIVVYVTDNGWVQNPDKPGFVRSKRSPYDTGLRTPILVRWPGKVKPAAVDRPVLSLDIAPTLLKAVGLKPTAAMPGVDLLDDAALAARRTLFGECFTHDAVDLNDPAANLEYRWALADRWKLIVPKDGSNPELYDVVADPDERRNRAADDPARVKELRARLDTWWTPEEKKGTTKGTKNTKKITKSS
ncbi:MAG: sulfatase-like hydrolase/transferase [Gemmataceae bacterium]